MKEINKKEIAKKLQTDNIFLKDYVDKIKNKFIKDFNYVENEALRLAIVLCVYAYLNKKEVKEEELFSISEIIFRKYNNLEN